MEQARKEKESRKNAASREENYANMNKHEECSCERYKNMSETSGLQYEQCQGIQSEDLMPRSDGSLAHIRGGRYASLPSLPSSWIAFLLLHLYKIKSNIFFFSFLPLIIETPELSLWCRFVTYTRNF
ncbi:hypothetical protein KFK09_026905 [Dendrobium nobile]|uniref:Uncharacterized protein n=1 Tax=Dendrobium nobile TaxID=94219 RepID=A0A8T3A939_DENNO|nr:hypothetical protein KFK09_026905 [Dendrobium nobile]